jgi:hypothetical protein
LLEPSSHVIFGYFDESVCSEERITNFVNYHQLTKVENNFPFKIDHTGDLWNKLIDGNEFVFDSFTEQVKDTIQ